MLQTEINALAEAEQYANPQRIHDLMTRMRKEDPVVFLEPEGFRPFWAVTRYDDIKFVEQNWKTFIARPRTTLLTTQVEQATFEVYGEINPTRALTGLDGDVHQTYRRLGMKYFMPAEVRKMAPGVEALAKLFVDKMYQQGGKCDFAADIAFYYPLRVVLQLVGVPEADEARVLLWTQRIFGMEDPEFSVDENGEPITMMDTVQAMGEYFMALVEERRQSPQNDIATELALADINGQPMQPRDLIDYFILLCTAGHDTTSATIAGGLQTLIEHPDQLEKLKNNPQLLDSAVDEMIRWVAPVKHFVRTATEDIQVGDRLIKEGESLALFYASACRDESIFERADQFDIERGVNKHLAFGFGPHVCLGQHLARLEIKAFFSALLPRLEYVEICGEPKMLESIFVTGLKSLPIRYSLKKQSVYQ